MARLPTVGGDDGNWGNVLNTFLRTEHNADGTHNQSQGIISTLKDRSLARGEIYADEYSSLTDAVNAVGDSNVIVLSGKSYTIPSAGLDLPSNVWLKGVDNTKTILVSDGNVLAPTTSRTGWHLSDLQLRSNGNHIVTPAASVSNLEFRGVYFNQTSSNHSIWYDNSHAGLESSIFDNCLFYLTVGHTVPGWVQVGSGNVNQNMWRDSTCYYGPSDGWFFDFSNINNQGWIYANTWSNLVFEVVPGGLIRLLSTYHSIIENCHLYDSQNGNTEDLIYLGRDATSTLACYNTRISDFARYGGSMSAGKYDINIVDSRYTLLENCQSGPFASWKINIDVASTATTNLVNTPSSA